MPTYIYRCRPCNRTEERTHSMMADNAIVCVKCHGEMHRVPQAARVNWGQPAPSRGGLHPVVAEYNRDLPRLREEHWAKKEARKQ